MNFTRIFSYFFTRMYPYVSRMLVVCYSYVSVCSVCYSYVTRMYSCGVLVMIVLAAQINRKIESDIAGIQRAP